MRRHPELPVRHHHHVSVVVPLDVETVAVGIEAYVVSRLGARHGTTWGRVQALEPPFGTAYWPRIVVEGSGRIGRHGHRSIGIELHVWPWSDDQAEIGIAPEFGAWPITEPLTTVWTDLAERHLQDARAIVMHPAHGNALAVARLAS